MQEFSVGTLDLGIVVFYLVFVVLLGLYFGAKHKGTEDYFLAGRNLTWPLIGFSLFASNMSSNSLVGLTGSGYKDGFSVFSYEWMAVFVLIIFAIFFLPFYLKNKVYTVPEFLERRFDYFTRGYASVIAIILNVVVDVAATLYAGGVAVQLIFPQYPLWLIIGVLAIIAGLYTISGGLSAVVYTDAIQAVILIGGSIVITIFAWQQSGGFEEVAKITDPSHFNIIKGTEDEGLPWPGLIGVLIIGFYFWGTNQYITQRTLAAKNVIQGQWGSMFAGLLKLSILFIMIFPGAFARVLYPDFDLEKIDTLYPTMLFDLLPTGVLGIVLAGFIAALMSSIDSGLNSISTLVTMDFIKKFKPGKSDKELMKVGRWVTIIVMIIATAWAPQIVHFDQLWSYLQKSLSWFCPPIVALFVTGLFWKGSNTKGAHLGIIIGGILTVFVIIMAILYPDEKTSPMPHFLYTATLHFVITAVAIVVGSLMAGEGKSQEVLRGVVWSKEEFNEESIALKKAPFYKNYRYQGIALVIIVILILLYF